MSHWHVSKDQARKARLAKALGPKPERSATKQQAKGGMRAPHGAANQPLDKQAEQLKSSIDRIGADLTKAATKGNRDTVNRLATLLANQQARLALVLDKLATSPGFAPGTTFKAKATDHASYHPHAKSQRPKASHPAVTIHATEDAKTRALEALAREEISTARQQALGRPKGTKA